MRKKLGLEWMGTSSVRILSICIKSFRNLQSTTQQVYMDQILVSHEITAKIC